MYLNRFSESTEALDLAQSEEFASLCQSASDLDIAHDANVPYSSANTVLRHQRFHYLSWGQPEATPIVLLHGSNQSAHSWDLVSLNLASDHRVLALDQRGHGDSEWSRGAHYSIDEMVEDAAHFIGRHTSTPPVLVGHSMGGMVTLALACRHPHLVRSIVIVDMGPEVSAEGRKMIGNFVGRNIEFDDMETFVDRVAEYDPYRSREHIERTLKYNLIRRADGRYVSKADRRRYRTAEEENAEGPQKGVPSAEDIASLTMPALVVRGADSNVLEQLPAERFADALTNGRLVVVPEAGHNVASQNTPAFLEKLREFLAQ